MKAMLLAVALCITSSLAVAVKPFELPDMNAAPGTVFKSADHPTSVFVVETFFLNCPYCNDNAENVDKLADKYKGDDRVHFLDVGIDRSPSQYSEWIRRHSPNHPVLNDSGRKLISQLGTSVYPTCYVLDCQGRILYQSTGVWNSTKVASIEQAIQQGLNSCKGSN